jgi:tetratricopeptide (TPR) repeat protein
MKAVFVALLCALAFMSDAQADNDGTRAIVEKAAQIARTLAADGREVCWDTWVAVADVEARLGARQEAVRSFSMAWRMADKIAAEEERRRCLEIVAEAQANAGQVDEACAETDCLASEGDRVYSIQEIARSQAAKSDIAGALRVIGHLPLDDSESHVEALRIIGVALARHNDVSAALKIANDFHPDHRLAELLLSRGQPLETQFRSDRVAIKRATSESVVVAAAVESLARAGQFEEAMKRVSQIAISAQRSQALADIVCAACKRNSLDIAAQAFAQLANGPERDDATVCLSKGLAKAGKFQEAGRLASEVTSPVRTALADWSIATEYARRGDDRQAWSWYSRGLTAVPATSPIHCEPAKLIVAGFGESSRADLAIRFVEQFADPSLISESLEAAAVAAFKHNNTNDVHKLFERSFAISNRIDNPTTRLSRLLALSRAQLTANDKSRARVTLDAAASALHRSNIYLDEQGSAYLNTAELEMRLGDPTRARQVLEDYVAKVNGIDDSEARRAGLRAVGHALIAMGDCAHGLQMSQRQQDLATRCELLLGLSLGLLDKPGKHN